MRRGGLLALLLLVIGCAEEGGFSFAADPAFPEAPLLPPAQGPRLVITNSGEDTLSFVDPESFEEIARLPVGILPMELEGAHHVAGTPDGRFLFVGFANSVPLGAQASGPHGNHGNGTSDGYLIKIDAQTGRQLERVRVERSPGDVRLQPGGKRVWQSHYDLVTALEDLEPGAPIEEAFSNAIVTDADTMQRVARVPLCPAGHGIGFSPAGDFAYVTCGLSDELAIVDTGDFSVRRVAVEEDPGLLVEARYQPYALAVAPDGKVWVSNTFAGPSPTGFLDNRGIVVIDPVSGERLDALSIATEGTPFFGSFRADGSRFYVVTQNPDHLLEIAPARGEIVRSLAFGAECLNAHTAVLSPDQSTLWVVCEGDRVEGPGALLRIDAATLERTARVEVGIFPDDVIWLQEVR